jgi:predicted hydrolase (HD superfamily)
MTDDPSRNRAAAIELLEQYVESEALRRHALAVEAAVRWYARAQGEDEETWGCVALLHDFDWEIHPTLEHHPTDGEPILRERGYPPWFTRAILSHARHTGVPPESPLERTLFACDELSGFVHACGLVRPTGLVGLEPKSVRKKLKQASFAAGVDREDVVVGAELIGLPLDEHIRNIVAALLPISATLGLPAPDA